MKKGLRKIKGKRGAGHFEMIAAFILFFTFVIFLLIYIKPYQTGTLQASVVAGLHDSFKEQSQTNLSKFFLKANNSEIDGSFTKTCFKVNLPGEIFGTGFVFSDTLVRAADNLNDKKIAELDDSSGSSNLDVEGTDVFYYVMISPDFNDTAFNCADELDYYNLGSIDSKKVVSYNQLLALKEKYENDYSNLKKDMNFPEAYDFSIVSSLITMEGVVPEEGDVMADDYIEEVLFENGTIINQRFTLKVW